MMLRIETLVLWRILHVAFTIDDFQTIADVSVGLSEDAARSRCYERNLRRTEPATRKDPQ